MVKNIECFGCGGAGILCSDAADGRGEHVSEEDICGVCGGEGLLLPSEVCRGCGERGPEEGESLCYRCLMDMERWADEVEAREAAALEFGAIAMDEQVRKGMTP